MNPKHNIVALAQALKKHPQIEIKEDFSQFTIKGPVSIESSLPEWHEEAQTETASGQKLKNWGEFLAHAKELQDPNPQIEIRRNKNPGEIIEPEAFAKFVNPIKEKELIQELLRHNFATQTDAWKDRETEDSDLSKVNTESLLAIKSPGIEEKILRCANLSFLGKIAWSVTEAQTPGCYSIHLGNTNKNLENNLINGETIEQAESWVLEGIKSGDSRKRIGILRSILKDNWSELKELSPKTLKEKVIEAYQYEAEETDKALQRIKETYEAKMTSRITAVSNSLENYAKSINLGFLTFAALIISLLQSNKFKIDKEKIQFDSLYELLKNSIFGLTTIWQQVGKGNIVCWIGIGTIAIGTTIFLGALIPTVIEGCRAKRTLVRMENNTKAITSFQEKVKDFKDDLQTTSWKIIAATIAWIAILIIGSMILGVILPNATLNP
jgi:hypothetical protein